MPDIRCHVCGELYDHPTLSAPRQSQCEFCLAPFDPSDPEIDRRTLASRVTPAAYLVIGAVIGFGVAVGVGMLVARS